MQRRLMSGRFLTRAWNRLQRPVSCVYSTVLRRSLRAESLRFVDETIDAGYATYRTLATVRAPVESLFPVQVGLGPVSISSTPHFSFVKAHLGHERAGWNKNDWKRYITDESSSPPSSLAPRQGRFERLIDEIREKPADVNLLVALNPRLRGFEIVDGFPTVSCSLVSHIVA